MQEVIYISDISCNGKYFQEYFLFFNSNWWLDSELLANMSVLK